MPQGPAARLGDAVVHPLPPVLTGVPAKVLIGMQPAWKGIPLAAAPGIMATNKSTEATLQALETTAKVAQAAALAAAGTPGAPAAVAAAAAARLAAETAKATSAAANSASIAAAAAGGASMHVCALPWPIPPHGPGVVIDGSATVMIENCPACRLGDTIIEAIGPPNKIVMGCMTVIIGDSGPITTVQRGSFAITVNRINSTITITGKEEFFGDGATQAVVDQAINSINTTWSGSTTFEGNTYTVTSQVTGSLRSETNPADPHANQMRVKHTTDPPSVHKNTDPANQPYYGRTPGMIHDNEDDGGSLSIPHEMGHAMGLGDEYHENYDANGNPLLDAHGHRTLVRTGPNGGLMGYVDPGSRPTDQNYSDLITGNNLAP